MVTKKVEFKEIDFGEAIPPYVERWFEDQMEKKKAEVLEMIVGHFSSLRFLASMARKDIKSGIKLNEELYKEIEVLQKQIRDLSRKIATLEKKIK